MYNPDQKITVDEQIACIDRNISVTEELIRRFDGDDQFSTGEAKRELIILQSIRESLEFDYAIEAVCKDED